MHTHTLLLYTLIHALLSYTYIQSHPPTHTHTLCSPPPSLHTHTHTCTLCPPPPTHTHTRFAPPLHTHTISPSLSHTPLYTGIESLLNQEGIPVDHLSIRKSIPRDRRHQSKPNTAALFNKSNPNSASKIIKLILKANTVLALVFIFIQMILIVFVSLYIFGNL